MLRILKTTITIITFVILSLILLELCLQRFSIPIKQHYYNKTILKNKTQYTIMCLGDSSTAGQYPIQLQKMLNEKYPNKFSVVDCGIPSATSETILDLLDSNVEKYNPNIAICMTGINGAINKAKVFYKKLKIYNMYIFLCLHLKNLLPNNIISANNNGTYDMEAIYLLKHNGKFKQLEKILHRLLQTNPNDDKIFAELTNLYAYYLQKKNLAYKMAIKGIDENFQYRRYLYYKVVFDFNKIYGDSNTLLFYINKLINDDIYLFHSVEKIYFINQIKKYLPEEQKNKVYCYMKNTNDIEIFDILAIDAIGQQNYQKAKECFDKAEEIRLKYPDTKTYNLYKLIIKKLINNNIKVICMQYPVRSLKTLKQQLKNESYYDKITFVNNEQNFKDALTKKNYDEFFRDNFGGNFGHCTDLGNTMIAENIVKTLENILDLKNK